MSGNIKIIIIGSGPGGYVAAARAGQLGMDVTLIEKDNIIGGTCLHRGCIPTKALLHQAHLYNEITASDEKGISVKGLNLDMTNLMLFKQNIVDNMEKGIKTLLKKNGVEIIHGRGKLIEAGKVLCRLQDGSEKILNADHVILATGSEAKAIPGTPFDGKTVISNVELLQVDTLPESLAVIGAGAVGVEFATILHSFGKEVTIVEMLPQIVPLEDDEISKELARAFKKKKLKVITEAMVTDIKTGGAKATITYERKGTQHKIEAEKVLVAIGRTPNIEDIGLEEVGIEMEHGFVKVSDDLSTSVPGVWAIGDIIPTPQLAHAASAEGIFVIERITGLNPERVNPRHIPGATYSELFFSEAGTTERQAIDAGYEVKTGKCRFNTMAKAHILGATEGFVKVVADTRTDKLLGLHIIGPLATEMIAEGVTALELGATIKELRRSIHPHPTLSEALHEAFDAVDGSAIHS